MNSAMRRRLADALTSKIDGSFTGAGAFRQTGGSHRYHCEGVTTMKRLIKIFVIYPILGIVFVIAEVLLFLDDLRMKWVFWRWSRGDWFCERCGKTCTSWPPGLCTDCGGTVSAGTP